MRVSRVSATGRPPWDRTGFELSSAIRRIGAEGMAPTGETPCRYRIQIPLRVEMGFIPRKSMGSTAIELGPGFRRLGAIPGTGVYPGLPHARRRRSQLAVA